MAFRSIIMNQFWLKLFSVILATLIWLTVKGNLTTASFEENRTFLSRPIQVLSDTAEHGPIVVNPSTASVTVRGPASLVREFTEQDIHVFVRMADRHQFAGELPVHVHLPAGASVALVTPTTATIKSAASP